MHFSILWWIGVMETLPLHQHHRKIGIFQYPLVDWGDGDDENNEYPDLAKAFQYPLVDWGDGDVTEINVLLMNRYFSILWWIGVMETVFAVQSSADLTGISVSSGGLG